MQEHTKKLHRSREAAPAGARVSLSTVSALLLAVATAGCSVDVAEGEGSAIGANSEVHPGSAASVEQGAPFRATQLRATPPAPLTGCAPLCAGSCTPVALVNRSNTRKIAVTDQHVVFSGGTTPYFDDGFVARVPKAGGPVEWIVRDLEITPSVQVAGPTPYFTIDQALKRVNANGTMTDLSLSVSVSWPPLFMGDATHFYWVSNDDNNIYGLSASDRNPALAVPSGDTGKPLQALMDADSLYWVSKTINGKGWNLWKAPRSGGAAPTLLLFVPAGQFRRFALDATDIYFIDYFTGVNRIPKNGGAVVNITNPDDPGDHLVVDDERFYWLKDGVLMATCKDGTGDQVLTSNTYFTEELFVDSSGIYWVQFYDVWKIAK